MAVTRGWLPQRAGSLGLNGGLRCSRRTPNMYKKKGSRQNNSTDRYNTMLYQYTMLHPSVELFGRERFIYLKNVKLLLHLISPGVSAASKVYITSQPQE